MYDIKRIRKRLDSLLTEYTLATRQVAEEEAALKVVVQEYRDSKQAQEVLQHAAQAVQQAAHEQVALIVTRCLRAVFGDDSYEFLIEFDRKRGKTEAKFTLKRGDLILEDPLSQCGGGVIDVCSFALRLACLLSTRPAPRKLLVLDEPAKMLSSKYSKAVGRLFQTLSKELGVQMIIVTHNKDFCVGDIVEL